MPNRKRKPQSPVAKRSKKSHARKKLRLLDENELLFYARSFHRAAKALAGFLQVDGDSTSDMDFSPVVNMYRQALELHLKAIVLGSGCNFLETRPDVISVHKTHSVSWLAQFVAQIVSVLKWEPEFRCVGIENLDDFKKVVEEVNSVDPGSYTFSLPGETEGNGAFDVRGFAAKMDAVIGLLDAAADALAAEWDLRSAGTAVGFHGDDGGFGPTIQ